ncbi:MAG: 3-phosphoshikimate 1-carboxyvinyltransferase [Actinomycetota bacterium]|jgi:3-phosphoshikimate 1-carboxyvinyltransferase
MKVTRVSGAAGPIDAVVSVPGSKSVANRALMCAALVADSGASHVRNVPGGDDCVAMANALVMCGAMRGDTITGGIFPGAAERLDAGIAGTTSRFLTAAAALSNRGIVIDGGEPLRRRPMADLHDALRRLGATVEQVDGSLPGHLPVVVKGGHLGSGAVSVRGDVSSQFVSALMLLAPRLPDGLVIEVIGDLVSRPYVEMTASVMADFGASVSVSRGQIIVKPGRYVATDYLVEPDYSSAAFPLMALAFSPGTVKVPGLRSARLQGDSYVLDIARQMGLEVSIDGDDVVVRRGSGAQLRAVNVNLADASDLVPAVAVACTAISGRSTITGVGFIRAKESDRLGDLAAELNSVGSSVTVEDDGLSIHGGTPLRPVRPLATHHDHRLAMAFALMALGGQDVDIIDADVVSKSWPSYFADMSCVLGAANVLH